MDEEKRIEQQKRLNDLLEKGIGLSSAYNDTVKELLGVQSKRSTFDSNLLKINRQINTSIYNTKTEFNSISQIGKEISKNQEVINRAQAVSNNLIDSLGTDSKDIVNQRVKEFKELQNLVTQQENLLKQAAEGGKFDEKKLEDLDKEIFQQQEIIDNAEDNLSILEKQAVFTKLNTQELEKQNEALKDQKDQLKSLGIFADIFGAIPGLGEASKDAFKDVSKEISDGNLKTKGFVGFLKTGGKFIGSMVKSLRGAVTPLLIFKQLVQGILEADKQVTELGKSTAQTKFEAALFRTELAEAATASGDLFVTSTKLVKTFNELNKQFGFITNFSTDTLVTVTKLTEKVGLAADAAGNLAAASLVNGGSLEDNYKNVLATSYELQRQTGVQFDLREISEATANTTGQIRANLGANPALISEAVTQAKLFGGEMEDIKNISSALLDFESSISNELQAELLTGKALNLERARFAALNGDIATVSKEINEQVGDFGDFTKMNVIQQDALAASLGLSSDRLSDILFKQEVQNKSVRELRALGKEELAQRLEQTNVQQKLNAAIDKMKSLFTDVGLALLPLGQLLGGILGLVGTVVGAIRDVIVGAGYLFGIVDDFGRSGFLGGLQSVGNSFGMSLSFADDAMIPGYGKRMLMDEGKITAFNDNDNIVATTNEIKPVSAIQPQTQVVTPEINLDVSGLREDNAKMMASLREIVNKEGTVTIDSSTAGRAFTVGTFAMQ